MVKRKWQKAYYIQVLHFVGEGIGQQVAVIMTYGPNNTQSYLMNYN